MLLAGTLKFGLPRVITGEPLGAGCVLVRDTTLRGGTGGVGWPFGGLAELGSPGDGEEGEGMTLRVLVTVFFCSTSVVEGFLTSMLRSASTF